MCVFSCTKGVVAMATMWAVARGLVDLDAPVATYWPEFAAEDKGDIPVRWLLTHEAGLPAIAHPHAARFAQRLGRDDERARRAGPVVGTRHGARLSRRHVRPPGR